MLHDLLSHYLQEIDAETRKIEGVYIELYEEEFLTPNRINLRFRIRFETGHLFELNEAVIVKNDQLEHLNYRYHFQDKQNNLVFRYDNTPHFPDLDNFPHHKHLSDSIVSSQEPSVLRVIEEAVQLAK